MTAPARKEKAQATRRRMIEAATRLISERGYSATTMADIAAEAGVAVQTVYFTFHTKFSVLREAFDFAVVGDDTGESPHHQEWFKAVRDATDIRHALDRLVDHVTVISRRVAPMAQALRSLGNDPEAEAFHRDRERLRHEGYREMLTVLTDKRPIRRDLTPGDALDIFFALLSPELYLTLVIGRGWTEQRWRQWIAGALREALFQTS